MTKRLISTGSAFEAAAGYSRAVATDTRCYVAGTTGYDYASMTLPDDLESQARNTLGTIEKALGEAGFSMADVVRVRTYVSDRAHARPMMAILSEAFGDIRPASTMAVAELIEPEIKVEIEVTAERG